MQKLAYLAGIAGVVASAALAEVERLQPDFTFRRVGVPGAGESRITVQIDPNAQSAIRPPNSAFGSSEGEVIAAANNVLAALAAPVSGAASGGGSEWFWNTISPLRADSRPGRLAEAVAHLANAPAQALATPRMQGLQEIARVHGREILGATVGTRVSPALVLAVISVESRGDAAAESRAGAQGLMQLMPDTAARFGVTDSLDPAQNIRGGVAYLDWLMGHFDGDPLLVLAGYNAGEGSVRDNLGVPPFAETRAYVPKVLSAWTVARGLCQTPPQLVSDGCVFAVNNL